MLPGHGGTHVGRWAEGSELLVMAKEMDMPFLDACDEKTLMHVGIFAGKR